ncbi:unnamed protein product [Vicia faba]|uniref:DUF7745 domain-containing protein n=1 Tax=Vicia faba TaxID=3906 RepID=A0AAV1ATL5_VICFA|nr:unnamed protein product [Vicia faba]
MASMRRNIIRISFVQIPTQLKDLVSKVPDTSSFIRRHGHLLGLVTSKMDEQMMSVLCQFFDPLYHCFTFPDYQLVPTLEEFYDLLGISILEQMPFTGWEKALRPEEIASTLHLTKAEVMSNWDTRSGTRGFLAKFLVDPANQFWDSLTFSGIRGHPGSSHLWFGVIS